MGQVGCAPGAAPAGSTAPSAPAGGPPEDDGATKTLVIAQAIAFTAMGPFTTNNTSGGGVTLLGIHSTGLVSLDGQGREVPRIAAAIPSLSDGSVVLLPDGKMRTTWRLRPDVTWHDGTKFTADDVAFTQKVRSKIIPGNPADVSPFIEQIDVPDPLTAVMTWKTPYYPALFMDFRSFYPLPQHLLGKAFEEDNEEVFLRNPYFTTEYVNTGPFRLTDWGQGTETTYERYPNYFLGLPKVGKIIIKAILDPNVIAASVRAGAIDIVANKALSANVSVVLRDEWRSSNEGSVVSRQENWIYLQYQWDPQQARPLEVSRDARLRTGLYEGIDRAAIREFQFPGVPDTNADSFIPAADPRVSVVGQPFARHPYDPNRATAHLTEGGWTQGVDGKFLDRSGAPAQ
ncbi:MAG TPA: ABC transporter substrate-binding protein, partial [Chloroflexota bacterium]